MAEEIEFEIDLYEKGKGKYQRLYNFLSQEREIYPDEEELKKIIYYAKQSSLVDENVGIRPERILHNDREKAFHDEWIKENDPSPGINHGQGILQDLFIEPNKSPLFHDKWTCEITKHERMIVATVIQWLGSNCGFAFLHDALRRCGYEIVQKKSKSLEGNQQP